MSVDKRAVHTDALETLGTIHTREEHRDAIHLAVEPIEAGMWLHPGEHVKLIDGKAHRIFKYSDGAVGIVDPFLRDIVEPGQKFWLVVYPRMITSLRHVWEHPAFPTALVEPDTHEVVEEVSEPEVVLNDAIIDLNSAAPIVIEIAEPEILTPVNDAKIAAYNWICKFAESISNPRPEPKPVPVSDNGFYAADEYYYGSYGTVTAEELIGFGTRYYNDHKRGGYPEYLVKGGLLEGEYVPDEFWDQLGIYLEEEFEEAHRGSFFSCRC